MIFGIPLAYFTALHVALSVTGLVSGFLALLIGPLGSRLAAAVTGAFLASTLATTVTGFMFPFTRLGPGHVAGALTLVVLAPALVALYRHRLAGPWRRIYAIAAAIALALNLWIALLQAAQLVLLALLLALWFLVAQPPTVRQRTLRRPPGPQPPMRGVRFLRTTNSWRSSQ